jgi:hypothetical protein
MVQVNARAKDTIGIAASIWIGRTWLWERPAV